MIFLNNITLNINNQLLLKEAQLNIYEGSIHCIMGESGSGKTTLLYELSLLSHISDLSYEWDGKRIDHLSEEDKADIRRCNIGYVLQDLELISEDLTLMDNIISMYGLVGKEFNEDEVNTYMNKMNLYVSLNQNVDELSRGERQRFALVLALIKDAKLIICDEPTSSLDMDNTVELMKYLKYIARKYHKMIVIASHDDYLGECSDVLYKIENYQLNLIRDEHNLYESVNINKDNKIVNTFYLTYKKVNKKVSRYVMNSIYLIMIVALCIIPLVLNLLLEGEQELYDLYATNEIIIVNTLETLPYLTYSESCEILDEDQFNMLREIEHIDTVQYYWEISGSIISNDDFDEILIVPKLDIKNIVLSSNLSEMYDGEIKLYGKFMIEDIDYEFSYTFTEYDVRDYPAKANVNCEVVYIPYALLNSLLEDIGVTMSSSVLVVCDDMNNVEETVESIQRWMPNSTVTSSGLSYYEQIESLENISNYIGILRFIVVIGVISIVYVLQSMENKSREMEITNLRINGLTKNSFYSLYAYENSNLILLTLLMSMLLYVIVKLLFNSSLSIINIILLILEVIIYIILTRVIPLFVSVNSIFSKDIALILRENQ